jgi:hypothetical protein
MVFIRMLCLVAASGLSIAASGENPSKIASVPGDPLEMATGHIRVVSAPADREAVVKLLARARNSYALRSAGRGYDVKVTFNVNSQGQTDYDGAWEMEDLFDPQQGLRWTAQAAAGFKVTRISAHGMSYGEGTASTIPLRLQEARAALFDPIPAEANIKLQSIRTSTALNGGKLTCILLSGSRSTAAAASGRRWDETEECIDPQSGLLQVHSQVPGRYYAYDYTNALRFGDHVLPGKAIVTEAGKIVSTISVDSLTEFPAADPGMFTPTAAMKAAGGATALASAQKILTVSPQDPGNSDATTHTVCVFGLVTASGHLVEAHSLQPSDPNSGVALEAVKRMTFSAPGAARAQPRQHFVFVIERFVPSDSSLQ